MMKKWMTLFLSAFVLMCGAVLPVHADDFLAEELSQNKEKWQVTFTAGNEMASNFSRADINDVVSELQPGDSVTFTVALKNENPETADWYMSNRVLSSLEKSAEENYQIAGGAYTYVLTYTNSAGVPNVLFSNETLGGDSATQPGVGLEAVSSSLQNFFFLDTFAQGQSGTITLRVSLEGETQGNAYQNTLANLEMNFAVELGAAPRREDQTVTEEPTIRRTTVVKTGDETNLTPFYIAMAVSGILILLLAFYSMKQGKKKKEERS
ncbi:MAG: hypothetical protein NC541_13775 [bacterium]|nr:hypothetical protein [bacterium]